MDVLLTGSTGFIGSHLLNQLVEKKYTVSCLVRKDMGVSVSPLVKSVKSDLGALCNLEVACNLVKGHKYIIHCAAIRGEMRLPWSEYYKVNVEATATLLKAAGMMGVKRFVYLSSVGVLGTTPAELPASEKTPYQPDSDYHRSKMLAEKEIIRLSKDNGLSSIIIRPSVTYGPGDNGFFRRVTRIAARGVFPIVRGGGNIIHLTYVEGLVDAIIKSMDVQTFKNTNIYTVVDSNPMDFRSLIELIADSLNKKVRFINIPSSKLLLLGCKTCDTVLGPVKKGLSLTMSAKILALPWYYNNQKARLDLSYKAYDTRRQVPKTVKWLLENGQLT
ncbi:MAG: NAD-dependent epimerase/dehydratase family protein [Desulfocucumaceae bacterium]